MVKEVSAASEAQDGVGQLQGEMSRLAELTGFSEAGGDKKRGSVRSSHFSEKPRTAVWRRPDRTDVCKTHVKQGQLQLRGQFQLCLNKLLVRDGR